METEANKMAKQPSYRFAGYTEAWEQRKLGEYCDITTGKLDANAMVTDGEYDFYTSGIQKYKIDVAAFEGPAITIAGNGATVGYMYYADGKFNAYQRTYVLSNFLADRSFIYSEIGRKLPSKIQQEARTGNIPYIVMDMLTKLDICLPSLPEQTVIGSFFQDIDQLISLQQRKLEVFKEQKKTYLKLLFPAKGQTKPALRFAGFEDEWEQQKASEIFYSVSDKNHVDLPVLSASQEHGMVKRDEIGIDIKYDKASVKTYKRVKPGQFVIHLRSFQGGFAYSDIEGITSPAYTVIDFSKSNKHFDLFWKEVFTSQNFIKRLETVTYGIRDGRSISFSDFSSLKLQCPSLPEQEAIGSFFQDLDKAIAKQEEKVNQLKESKQTLLRKMFI